MVGYAPPVHPHHRPSAADDVTAPWPGLLVGGQDCPSGAINCSTAPPVRLADDQSAPNLERDCRQLERRAGLCRRRAGALSDGARDAVTTTDRPSQLAP